MASRADVPDASRLNLIKPGWHEDIPLELHSLYRKIDKLLIGLAPGRVIELGCASGRYLERLKSRGWDVTGVDLHPQKADFVLQHDLSRPLPFGAEFDVVIAAEVIEHIVDTEAFLASCATILRSEGTLILTTPNLVFGVNRLLMLFGRRPLFAYADYHVRMFVWDDLKEKIGRHFTVEHLGGSHVLMGRRAKIGREFSARLGDRFPTIAAHFIVAARKR